MPCDCNKIIFISLFLMGKFKIILHSISTGFSFFNACDGFSLDSCKHCSVSGLFRLDSVIKALQTTENWQWTGQVLLLYFTAAT